MAQTQPHNIFNTGEMAERLGRYWWALLLTGIAWIVVTVIVFRFDYGTVLAVAVLFGVLAITIGSIELGLAAGSRGWSGFWRGLCGRRRRRRVLHPRRHLRRARCGNQLLLRLRRLVESRLGADDAACPGLVDPARLRARRARPRLLGRRQLAGQRDAAGRLCRRDDAHPRRHADLFRVLPAQHPRSRAPMMRRWRARTPRRSRSRSLLWGKETRFGGDGGAGGDGRSGSDCASC
jgi:hypothetical protein